MKEWKNKVVWITGAGSGLGKALALEFAKYGANLVLSGRREAPLLSVSDELKNQNTQSLAVSCDVTKTTDIEEALSKIIDTFGQLADWFTKILSKDKIRSIMHYYLHGMSK